MLTFLGAKNELSGGGGGYHRVTEANRGAWPVRDCDSDTLLVRVATPSLDALQKCSKSDLGASR